MRYLSFVPVLFLFLPMFAFAYIPILATPENVNDIQWVEEPEVSKMFYGELKQFPHMYGIQVNEPFILKVQIFVPDIGRAEDIINGLILKRIDEGNVEEIVRLRANEATWDTIFEPWGGDSYRVGSAYETELEAGVYLVEVSTPDNLSPYVLEVGFKDEPGDLSYLETVRRIAAVKKFFGKPQFAVVESPFVYVPLGVLLALMAVILYVLRRRQGNT